MIHTINVPVRFADKDAMGIAHHGNYVVWLEMGRIGWLAAAGVPYTEIAASGRHFAVTKLDVDYRAACRFGDTVRVSTELTALRSRAVAFRYELHNVESSDLLATASTQHVCVDLDNRTARLPDNVLRRLQDRAANS